MQSQHHIRAHQHCLGTVLSGRGVLKAGEPSGANWGLLTVWVPPGCCGYYGAVQPLYRMKALK